jgi:hypothetical protein
MLLNEWLNGASKEKAAGISADGIRLFFLPRKTRILAAHCAAQSVVQAGKFLAFLTIADGGDVVFKRLANQLEIFG